MTVVAAVLGTAALVVFVGVSVRLLLVLDTLGDDLRRALREIQATAREVAADLVVAQTKVQVVADDLASSHARADAADSEVPGKAGDAAGRSR